MHICIDGQPGSGKTTVAKRLSKHFSCIHINSGLWYRSVTFFALQQKIEPKDTEKLLKTLHNIEFFSEKGTIVCTSVENQDLLFSNLVDQHISGYADNQSLRDAINRSIRNIGAQTMAIIDGRDAGTNIFPNADLKFYFIAEESIRLKRIQTRNNTLETNKKTLYIREAGENRRNKTQHSADTILVDTSHLTIDTVFETLNKLVVKERHVRNSK